MVEAARAALDHYGFGLGGGRTLYSMEVHQELERRLAALAAWSGLNADNFIRSEETRPEPDSLAQITTYLRSDRNLSKEAAIALEELIKATYARLRERK